MDKSCWAYLNLKHTCFCLPGDIWKLNGGISYGHDKGMQLTSNMQRPRMLTNALQCTGQPTSSPAKNCLSSNVKDGDVNKVTKFRNPGPD